MIRRLALACVGLALCVAGATQLLAAGPETVAAGNAIGYIRTLQVADGGFPADGSTTSSPGATIDASVAFASDGIDPKDVVAGTKSPADLLSSQAAAYSSASAAAAAKLVVGVAVMHLDATSFGGIDPLAVMETHYNATTGQYGGDDLFGQALFMLGEASLHRPVPPASVTYVESLQKADGGWEDCSLCGGEDTNTTALVIRALIAAGIPATDQHVVHGLAYLKASQQADGGCTFMAPGPTDPDSTALCIQAIVAAGDSVESGGPWETGGGKTPLTALLAFQNAATGALQFSGVDSPFATYQGVPGLLLDAFPEQRVFGSPTPTSTLTVSSTASPTPTVTRTSVPTPTTTPLPTSAPIVSTATMTAAVSTPVQVATSVAPSPTRTSAFLGGAPTRTSSVLSGARLPNTGGGSPGGTSIAGLLLLCCGGLALAGASMFWRAFR